MFFFRGKPETPREIEIKTDEEEEDNLASEDELLDHIVELTDLIKEQTKSISALMSDIKELKQVVAMLQQETRSARDSSVTSMNDRYFKLVDWVQEQFVSMLYHTKEKAEDNKISPAMKAYLDRKATNGDGKLPLPG